METFTIQYKFILPDDREEIFDLRINADNLELLSDDSADFPAWTKLDFHQCPNCPLTTQTHQYCPAAKHLDSIVRRFDHLSSYDKIQINVTTKERLVSQETSAQSGISSLMGLIIATSGCPHTTFFRTMARFHLPLANSQESIYRVASTYLLAQYFLKKKGRDVDLELEGLKDIYENLQPVNAALSERLQAAAKKDSSTNAIVILDTMAQILQFVIEESLEEIRYLFEPFFKENLS